MSMWALGATVLTEVIKGVSNHIQNSAAPEPLYRSKQEPFENKQYQTTSERTAENYQHTSRRSYRSQESTCSNCSNHSDPPPSRSKPSTKLKTHKPKKGSVCIINVPENGNFEVTIKKTHADFAKMSIRDHPKQNTKKTPSKNFTKPQYNVAKPAPSQKTWMYLGRIKFGTSKDDLENFLSVRFPRRHFRIEPLALYRDGKLPCFKVLVDNDILQEFQDENLWPSGVKITKYRSNFKKN